MKALSVLSVLAVMWVLPMSCNAGTTGELTGMVVDGATQRPLAGARVIATSASQAERTVTDAAGRFAMVSLCPGTYTVSVTHADYQVVSYPGIVVHADAAATLAVSLPRGNRIAHVLVDGYVYWNFPQTGVTADVYRLHSALPFYDVRDEIGWILLSVPGLTAGTGPVLAR